LLLVAAPPPTMDKQHSDRQRQESIRRRQACLYRARFLDLSAETSFSLDKDDDTFLTRR
jgi:hypothetical protein